MSLIFTDFRCSYIEMLSKTVDNEDNLYEFIIIFLQQHINKDYYSNCVVVVKTGQQTSERIVYVLN